MKYTLNDLELFRTCFACPEQYEVFTNYDTDDQLEVGYMRLRHGYFYAECFGQTVYEARPNGDGFFGEVEREFYLSQATNAILNKLNSF